MQMNTRNYMKKICEMPAEVSSWKLVECLVSNSVHRVVFQFHGMYALLCLKFRIISIY